MMKLKHLFLIEDKELHLLLKEQPLNPQNLGLEEEGGRLKHLWEHLWKKQKQCLGLEDEGVLLKRL
jgi:hypothetical protein